MVIDIALKEAEQLKITGKKVTPFLLKRVTELTEGKSLKANQSLVYNNCLVASKIAIALKK